MKLKNQKTNDLKIKIFDKHFDTLLTVTLLTVTLLTVTLLWLIGAVWAML